MPHANTLALLDLLRNPSEITLTELKNQTVNFLDALNRAEQRLTALRGALDLADLTEDNQNIRGRLEYLNQKLGAGTRNIADCRKAAKTLLLTMENMGKADEQITNAEET